MTINVEDRKEVYTGNGATRVFSFDFKVNTREDVLVVRLQGVSEQPLLLDTDYTVTLHANQNASPGGIITLQSPLPLGVRIAITTQQAFVQPTPFTQGVHPATLEAKFDNLTILTQQLLERVNRALLGGVTDVGSRFSLGPANARARRYVYFNDSGDVELVAAVDADALTQDVFEAYFAALSEDAKRGFYASTDPYGEASAALHALIKPRSLAETIAELDIVDFRKDYGDPQRYQVRSTEMTDMATGLRAAAEQYLNGGAPIRCHGVMRIATPTVITGYFDQPAVQCFTPDSQVSFARGTVSKVRPEWWGANANANVVTGAGVDSTLAFQAAIYAACVDTGGGALVALHPVEVGSGNYLVGKLLIPPASVIRGQGRSVSNLVLPSGLSGRWITDTGNAAKIVLAGLALYGRGVTTMSHGIQLGHNTTQHGVEGYLEDLWIQGLPNARLIDINGNVGFYKRIAAYSGQEGIFITGIANQASDLVSYGMSGVAADFNLCDVQGVEIEAPASGSLPVRISGNCTIQGLVISLANSTTLSHLVEFAPNATTWAVLGFHLGTATVGAVISNGNFKRADGTYFGGNATANNRTGEGNYSSELQGLRPQCFKLRIMNNGGVLQHRITDGSAAASKFAAVISGASASFTNTPLTTDATTNFAAGAKVGSASTSTLWFDTPPQVAGYDFMSVAEVLTNIAGGVTAVASLQSVNINGVTRVRLAVQFWSIATGAAFNLTVGNIAPGSFIDVKLTGALAP